MANEKESEHRRGGEGGSVVSRRSIITKTTAQPEATALSFSLQNTRSLSFSLAAEPVNCAVCLCTQINNKRAEPSRAETERAELSRVEPKPRRTVPRALVERECTSGRVGEACMGICVFLFLAHVTTERDLSGV